MSALLLAIGLSQVEIRPSDRGDRLSVRTDRNDAWLKISRLRFRRDRGRWIEEYRVVEMTRLAGRFDTTLTEPGFYRIEISAPEKTVEIAAGRPDQWRAALARSRESLTKILLESRSPVADWPHLVGALERERESILGASASALEEFVKTRYSEGARPPGGAPAIAREVGSSRVPGGGEPGYQPSVGDSIRTPEQEAALLKERHQALDGLAESVSHESAWYVLRNLAVAIRRLASEPKQESAVESVRGWVRALDALRGSDDLFDRLTSIDGLREDVSGEDLLRLADAIDSRCAEIRR
jgi:hypothetical protein